MNELLMSLCSYMALQANGDKACRVATNQLYSQSSIKLELDARQKDVEQYSLGIYNNLPLNKPLGAVSIFGYELYKKDIKVPLTSNINLEYSNFNTYTCNLIWRF
jgi:hypothetical protein